MEWIVWTKGLSKRTEILSVAEATGHHRKWVATTLMEFWEWADSETSDGLIRGATIKTLTNLLPDTDEQFWREVIKVGWLDQDAYGIRIPNFGRWMSKSAKKRLLNTKRQQEARSRDNEERDKSATKARPQDNTRHNKDSSSNAQAREPSGAAADEKPQAPGRRSAPGESQNSARGLATESPPAERGHASAGLEISLVERGITPPKAQLWVAVLHPDDLREILGFFDDLVRAGRCQNRVGALKSMLKDPEKWDFVRVDERLKRPHGVAFNEQPVGPPEPEEEWMRQKRVKLAAHQESKRAKHDKDRSP